MKNPKFWLSAFAFLFGLILVIISINTSVPSTYPSDENRASHRQFYLSTSILPDHVIYPAVMILDRFQLETTPFPERLWLQAEYGWRRLDYANKLLEKDKTALAITAFTKSQKYFLNAAQESLDVETSEEVRVMMLKHTTAYLWEAQLVANHFENANKAVADHLIDECLVLKHRLSQSLSN